MKENNGHAARRQLLKKLGVVLFCFCCCMGALLLAEYKYTNNSGRLPGQRRQSLFHKLTRRHRTTQVNRDLANKKEYKDILSADLTLISIEVNSHRAMKWAPEDSYDGILGTFCKINWAAHKEDPSAVPMFRDVQAASEDCEDTMVRVPLKEIAALARDMDEENDRQPTDSHVPKPLNFTGIAFHESRCGSTLVANTLIAMDPARNRVYSESPPPIFALGHVCGDDYEKCSLDQAAAILRDVLYMMGRTNDPKEERVFFKIQSVGARHIEVFRKAFPETPWLFVYRDPVQVMMSHFKMGMRKANCLRNLHHPPKITQDIAKKHGYSAGTSQLTPEEFCAAHLATLTEIALENLKDSDYGYPVDYDTLPNVMYEKVLPEKFGVPVGQTETDRILKVSGIYSKGRGDRYREWKEDSEKKEEHANNAVRQAAKQFMLESYEALQVLSGMDGAQEE